MKKDKEKTATQEEEKCLSFYKFYHPKLSSEKLLIPPAFISEFNGNLPKEALLRSPLGKLWHIELETVGIDMYFQNGWQCVVQDNILELGDFLVFGYNGRNLFDFKVYKASGCEKHTTGTCLKPLSKKSKIINKKMEEEEEEEEEDERMAEEEKEECKVAKDKEEEEEEEEELVVAEEKDDDDDKDLGNDDTYGEGDIDDDDDDDDDDYEDEGEEDDDDYVDYKRHEEERVKKAIMQKLPSGCSAAKVGENAFTAKTPAQAKPEKRKRMVSAARWEGLQTKGITLENNNRGASSNYTQVTALRRPDDDWKRYLLRVSDFAEVTIRPSYVEQQVHIPSCFSNMHLKGVNKLIRLETLDGRVWHVRCYDNGVDCCLGKGWREFVLDNGLKVGDVCVFRRRNTMDIVLVVDIIRKAKIDDEDADDYDVDGEDDGEGEEREEPARKSDMEKQLRGKGKHYGLGVVKVRKGAVEAETSTRVKFKTRSKEVIAT